MKKRMFLRGAALAFALLLTFGLFSCTAQNEPSDETTPESTEEVPAGPTVKNKRVAFTFDDGPTPGVTDSILDKLEELGGRATFFQVANRHNYVDNATYERIVELNCEIGSHTWNHPSGFTSMDEAAVREQLTKSTQHIETEWGKKVTLFRPVGGSIEDAQLNIAVSLGLHTVNWSLDTEDWKEQTSDIEKVADFIEDKVEYIVSNAEDGDIILMHELYLSSYEIFARAADRLTELGFELVTVSEILGLDESSIPQPIVLRKGDPLILPDAEG